MRCFGSETPATRPTHWGNQTPHHPVPVRNFSLPNKIGPTEGGSSVVEIDYLFLNRVFVSTTNLESLSEGQQRFPNDFLSVVVVSGIFPSIRS